jgi:hypothetical protein
VGGLGQASQELQWVVLGGGRTAEVEGCWPWLRPVVDFGGAIGLVLGFLLDVVLRKCRGVVGSGDHIPCSCACM